MGKKALIEGVVLLAAGLIGVVDGLRLVVYRNPKSIEDLTGPGRYLLAVSVLLVIVAVSVPVRATARAAGGRAGLDGGQGIAHDVCLHGCGAHRHISC